MNRLCGSGMDAVITAARAIKAGEIELAIAGGVESMSRAPFVMPKAESAFSRHAEIHDTTIGWRFVNPLMQQAIWRRFDAGDGRERCRGLQCIAGRSGRFCRAFPAKGRGGNGEWPPGPRNHPCHDSAAQGRSQSLSIATNIRVLRRQSSNWPNCRRLSAKAAQLRRAMHRVSTTAPQH